MWMMKKARMKMRMEMKKPADGPLLSSRHDVNDVMKKAKIWMRMETKRPADRPLLMCVMYMMKKARMRRQIYMDEKADRDTNVDEKTC